MLALLFFSSCYASASQLYFEGAAYLPSPGYTAVDSTGNKSLLSPVSALIGPRATLPLSSDLDFETGVRVVLPWRKNIDGNQRYYTSIFNFDLGYHLNEAWQVRAGVGFQWTYIRGNAATVSQRNGASNATFYVPAVSASVWQGALDFGFSYYLAERLRLTLDSAVWEVGSAARRRVAVVMGIDYGLF